jgi:ketosteroid isomerase-like protein
MVSFPKKGRNNMHTRTTVMVLAFALICVMACCPKTEKQTPAIPASSEILIETDCAFASLAADSGLGVAFKFYAADSATMLRDGSNPIVGKEVIGELYSRPLPGILTWEPYFADIGQSGDMGYTLGNSQYTIKDSTGAAKVYHGFYVTIWKKQADGSWKYVFDTGTDGPEEKKQP